MGDIQRGTTFADTGSAANVNAADLHLLVEDAVVNANAITTAKINDAAVATAKLADDAVTTVKILDDAITTGKIVDDAVTSAKIVDAAITLSHFSPAARPITYDFSPATALNPGTRGLVPEPGAGNQDKVLHGDGWRTIDLDTSASAALINLSSALNCN